MAIISTSDFKTFRGITVSTYDTLIGVLIADAEARVERWCGRNFTNTSRTQYYDGDDGEVIQVDSYPINSVTSVEVLSPDLQTVVQTMTANTDYIYRSETGQFIRTGSKNGRFGYDADDGISDTRWAVYPNWPSGRKNIKIVYTGGYTTFPDDLKGAMYRFVDWMYGNSYAAGGAATGYDHERLGEYDYTKGSGGVSTGASQVAVARKAYPSTAIMQEWFGAFKRGDLL